MKQYVVYSHTGPTESVYIGQTQNPKLRFSDNGNKYKGCHIFYNAIQKYGWDNFKHEILFEGLTKEDADRIEIELIAKYKKLGISYNITDGGGGIVGCKWSPESRAKASASAKIRANRPEIKQRLITQLHHGPMSEESRLKLSTSLSGEGNGMYGKHHSEETRRKIREKLLGHKASEETRQKIKKRLKTKGHPMQGKHHSEETRRKISEAHMGKPAYNKGVPCLESVKQAVSKRNKGSIAICNKSGVIKKIRPEELESYLLNGWVKGMKYRGL